MKFTHLFLAYLSVSVCLFAQKSANITTNTIVSARNQHPQSKTGEGFNICKSMTADIVVAGGGTGGYAAALAAARMGQRVIITEETDWLGGQLTSQGVPPDENHWIEKTGCTQLYRDFRNGVREYYKKFTPLKEKSKNEEFLNPGSGGVSRICHDPRIALQVLQQMMMPYFLNEQIIVLYNYQIESAETKGNQINSLTFRNLNTENKITLNATYYIDATELGDVLPVAGVEYVTGAESKNDTGEAHAVNGPAQPLNMQAISHCFAMDYFEGENHVIEKPRDYDFWVNYVPKMTPAWSGKQLANQVSDNITLEKKDLSVFMKRENGSVGGLFTFRQIANKGHFVPGFMKSNTTIVNWPMIDYWIKPIFELSPKENQKAIEEAKQLSLSYLYWMQTECPRHDGKGVGYPGLKLRKDIFGTEDGLAKYPYIRESRRIKGVFRVVEKHVSAEDPDNKSKKVADPFFDTVGIGAYRIDLHPSTGGNNYIDLGSLPFQIPLGALIPVRVENLLAGAKNIATTHITNGLYRLHPVEWNIGEAAGYLAAFCNKNKIKPIDVRNDKNQLSAFQSELIKQGVTLEWNTELMK